MPYPTAILTQSQDFLPEYSQKGFVFSNLDAFFEILPVWGEENNWLEELFSSPICGIKQNLANTKNMFVGLFGEKLQEKEILEKIILKYTELGYTTIVLDQNYKKKIFEAKNQDSVKVKLI